MTAWPRAGRTSCTCWVIEAGSVSAISPIQYDFPMFLAKNALEEGVRPADQALPPGTAPNMAGGVNLVGGVVRREPVGVVSAITPYNFRSSSTW